MSDIAAAAAALGIPEDLVRRSAEARATETGSTVDEILAAWAGGAPAPAGQTSTEEASPATEPEPDVQLDTAAAEAEPEISIDLPPSEAQPVGAITRAPVPSEVTMAEAANLPVVVTVPTVGIKERTNFAIPKWLATLFLIVPLFALFALGGSATGECGSATELETDVVSGEAVNCDGSTFEGSGVGGGGTDFIALGEAIYLGEEVSGVNCAGCHGAGGGGGAGPALNGVLNVFGACADHIEWIDLATPGLQAAGETTYGDTNKPLGGFGAPMPGFGNSLSEEQIAAVSAFERVRFGGQDPEESLTDCGLAEEATDGGETAPEGEEPAGEEGGEPSGEAGTEGDA